MKSFKLVCDPALYPQWLVGAKSIRHIDAGWPAVDTKFHHRIGIGLLAIPGSTTVRQIDAPHVLGRHCCVDGSPMVSEGAVVSAVVVQCRPSICPRSWGSGSRPR